MFPDVRLELQRKHRKRAEKVSENVERFFTRFFCHSYQLQLRHAIAQTAYLLFRCEYLEPQKRAHPWRNRLDRQQQQHQQLRRQRDRLRSILTFKFHWFFCPVSTLDFVVAALQFNEIFLQHSVARTTLSKVSLLRNYLKNATYLVNEVPLSFIFLFMSVYTSYRYIHFWHM